MSSERNIIARLMEGVEITQDDVAPNVELEEAHFEDSGKNYVSAFGHYSCDGKPITRDEYIKARDGKRQQSSSEVINKIAKSYNNSWGTKSVLSKIKDAGIDLNKVKSEPVEITSGRDPRLSGKGVIVLDMDGDGRNVGVWKDGKMIKDTSSNKTGSNYISGLSWKKIIDAADKIYYMDYDEDQANALRQKQAARADQKKGMVKRYGPKEQPLPVDKSGYAFDPDKYKKMLADMKVGNSEATLKKAKDAYTALVSNVDTFDWDSDNGWDTYEKLLRDFPSAFKELNRVYKDYNFAKDKHGESNTEAWQKWLSLQKENVANQIRNLDDIVKKLRNILKKRLNILNPFYLLKGYD